MFEKAFSRRGGGLSRIAGRVLGIAPLGRWPVAMAAAGATASAAVIGVSFIGFSPSPSPAGEADGGRQAPSFVESAQQGGAETFAAASDGELSLIGSGTRIVLFVFRIYDLYFYASDPERFDKERPLDSLETQGVVRLEVRVLTATGASRLIANLTTALKENDVDTEKEGIRKFFDVLNVSSEEGDRFVFTGYPEENALDVVAPGKEPVRISSPGIVRDVWSIWLGNVDHDGGMARLKSSLLN